MDLGFIRRGGAQQGAVPVPLDYARLVAGLSAMQAGSRTAGIEARLCATHHTQDVSPLDALVTVFEAQTDWITGVIALGGSFHPGIAGADRKRP